jgi:hypothetical protein
LDIAIKGKVYSLDDLKDNWITVTAENPEEWNIYVSLGTMNYRVTAHNENNEIIGGPTEWVEIACYATPHSSSSSPPDLSIAPGCLRISSPDHFDYNTILLSWTPIRGADNYLIRYRYSNWFFDAELEDNWLRVISSDQEQWQSLASLGKIYYSVSALDSDGNVIAGPTAWSSFICK